MAARIHPIVWPTRYVAYLQADDGDARDHLAHPVKSLWVGEGAKALRYTGPVEPRALRAVRLGWVRDGPLRGRRSPRWRLGRRRGGQWEHRPGLDLTLSPPKSVSILGLLGGDGRIVAAHERAVRRTLAWIESELVETRKTDPKTRRWSGWAARRWWRRCFSTPARASSTRVSTPTPSLRTRSSATMAHGARWPTKRSTGGARGSTRSTSRRLPGNSSALDTGSGRRIRTAVSRSRAYRTR